MSRVLFTGSLVAWLTVRVALGLLPGYAVDVDQIKSWALSAAWHGPVHVYETSTFDYPPVFLLFVYPIGKVYLALHPEITSAELRRGERDTLLFRTPDGTTYRHPKPPLRMAEASSRFERLPDDEWFTLLVKLPGLLFDLGIASILYALVAIRGTWSAARATSEWGRLAACCWLWNPAALWSSGYWGMPDAIHSCLLLAAFYLLGRGRWALAGAALAASTLMKPLGAPLVPLVAWVAAVRGGVRGFVVAGGVGVCVAILLFSPFFIAGVASSVLHRVLTDLEVMPFTSVNAHNLWWFVGGWVDSREPQLFGLSGRTIGIVLFLIAIAALLVANRGWLRAGTGTASGMDSGTASGMNSGMNTRTDSGTDSSEGSGADSRTNSRTEVFTARLMIVAAATAGSFFLLSTHMHENHLFTAIPFLTALAGRGRRFAYLAVGVSLVLLTNLVLHDPNLGMPTLSPSNARTPHGFATYINASAAFVFIGWLYWTALRARYTIL